MNKFLIIAIALLPCWVMAEDSFSCTYSKADMSNGTLGQFIGNEKAKVEVIKGSMKAFRPNGVYLSSPPMKDD